jgi:anti-sigma factor RsiW
MKVCNEVKRLIDEADRPDAISHRVSNHLSSCAGCRSFANERAALRALLASSVRVSVPNDFDAVLTARIARAKSGGTLSWLGAPSLMRLGAAAAAVAAIAFVAQYSNLFSNEGRVAQPEPSAATAANSVPVAPPLSLEIPPAQGDVNGFNHIRPDRSRHVAPMPVRLAQRYYPRRAGEAANDRGLAEGYSPAQEGGVVLVRGPNGEREIPLPTVSVGAQPLFYSRQSQPVRNVATSF